jgi:predicted lipoprotein
VALTGFPALEQILYDDERLPAPGRSTPDADYACALAAAIAGNRPSGANAPWPEK